MKRSRNPTRAEWDAIVKEGPGVRMWRGKMTLFYNGEKLYYDDEENFNDEYLVYTEEEREKWEVDMVLPGVEVIPEYTFFGCKNVKTVIMSDTVRRIEGHAFSHCMSLVYIRLSTNLEYIGDVAFSDCHSLTSMFIPQSCRSIGYAAFYGCEKLIIFSVSQHTQLGFDVIEDTALIEASPFPTDESDHFLKHFLKQARLYTWIKNHHADIQFSLHRACSSYHPLDEVIYDNIKRQGLGGLKEPDSIGITPFQYLEANPNYAGMDEQEIMKMYILEMTGEGLPIFLPVSDTHCNFEFIVIVWLVTGVVVLSATGVAVLFASVVEVSFFTLVLTAFFLFNFFAGAFAELQSLLQNRNIS